VFAIGVGMGQLAALFQDPVRQQELRREGGQYTYRDMVPLVEDLFALRRTWGDVTLLSHADPMSLAYGYIAFWEPETQPIYLLVPREAIKSAEGYQAEMLQKLILTSEGRRGVLGFVERESKKEDPVERVSIWTRLLEDESFGGDD
jgi:hypothetical protein